MTHDYKGVENVSDKLSSILLEAAKTSCKYKSKPPKNRNLKNKKWFDRDCSDKRKQFRHIANVKHKDPKNLLLRTEYNKIVKEFKNTCILKENLFWKSRMKALSEKYQTSEFWNIWKFLDQNVNDKEPALNDGDKWESYYSNLFQEDETNPNDNMTLISFNKVNKRILNNQNLNQIITYKEVKKIISKIKKRKAAGLDRILNEMLKSLTLFQPGGGGVESTPLQVFPSPSPQKSNDRLQTF